MRPRAIERDRNKPIVQGSGGSVMSEARGSRAAILAGDQGL